VGREDPPQWLQDLEAWLSILAMVGIVIASVIHLVIGWGVESISLPTWEAVLGSVIAFYFGERS